MHGAAVAFVLFELGITKCMVEVIAEGDPDDRVVVEFRDRLAQRFRQRTDPALAELSLG